MSIQHNLVSDILIKEKEKKKAFKRNIFLLSATILTIIYLGWRILFTLPLDDGIAQVIFGILLINAEVMTCFTTFELFYRKFKSDKKILDFPEVDGKYYPHIDVFIATHNESLNILYKTANACTFMEYPDKNKVHIYFCDDGNRDTVANLAKELGIGYLGLADNKDAKSGNLNNALSRTTSPLIATFDADMIPRRTFLMKTVPYFLLPTFIKEDGIWRKRTTEEIDENYKIGLIQTPQSFYNPDLFQFNLYSEDSIPNEQDFFSREVNIMRNSSNAIAYTGSNTVISRQAMIDIGGFPLHTITEDFETSIRIQKEHYITYATSQVQAAGLTTTDFKSMIKQRKRWARGVIQSLQNTWAIITPKLPMGARVTYFTSYLYWWSFFNRIIFILAPIMFALFDFRVVDCTFEELLIFWLPSYLLYSLSFRFLSSSVRTNRWSQTIDTIFAPYLIICIFLETIGIHEKKFKITSKEKKENSNLLYAIPHIILMILSVLAIVRFAYGKYGTALMYSSIIIFWLCYNLVSLTYAVFFMTGRKAQRQSERIKAKENITLYYSDVIIEAKTVDLSDEGLLFCHDDPIYVPNDEDIKVVIKSKYYESELSAKIVYVKNMNNKWYYALSVEPIDESNKRQYFQLIYDRKHSLPMKTDAWSSISDDIKRNIERRFYKGIFHKRKLPRVEIKKNVIFEDGTKGFIHDFNYQFLSISNMTQNHDVLKLVINDITLELKKRKDDSKNQNAKLFEVMNLKELTKKGVHLDKLIKALINV